MITNLFSSFDPTTSILSLNWLRLVIITIIIPRWFWLVPSRFNIGWTKLFIYLHKEFKILANSKGRTIIFIRLFSIIIINNFIGLFPYIFTGTRHISISLRLALPLWMTFIIFGWTKNTIHIFAHLVPQGTPAVLIPFIVCIETIRNVIRPGTLAIRLSANIIAGHLLLTLLGNAGNILSLYLINILIITQIVLLILEIAVSIIQSYVFAILSTLYSREVH